MPHRAFSFPFTAWLTLVLASSSVSSLAGCTRAERPSAPRTKTPPSLGSSRVPASASGPEPSAVALCTALHELPTRRRAECCAEAPVPLYFDECVRLLSSAVRAERLRIDRRQVEACAASVDAETRGCDWVAPTLGAAPAACSGAVSGLVAAGGRCTSSLECSGELHCAGQGATSPGVCRPPEPTGAACGAAVDSLATYLGARSVEARKPACIGSCALAEHRCAEKPAAGAACSASIDCASDQACTNGRCAARVVEAETTRAARVNCMTDLDCPAGGCVTASGGTRSCGKKCSRDLTALRSALPAQTPSRALSFPTKRERPAP